MGKLELPMPDLGVGLEAAAKDFEAKIKANVPLQFKKTIAVTPFRKGLRTGLAIEYDDRAENMVFAAIEYPKASGRGETVNPSK